MADVEVSITQPIGVERADHANHEGPLRFPASPVLVEPAVGHVAPKLWQLPCLDHHALGGELWPLADLHQVDLVGAYELLLPGKDGVHEL